MNREILSWLVAAPEHDIVAVPSWRASAGHRRMQLAARIVGEKPARDLAAKRKYVLEDSLVQDLRLQGLKIEDGKIPYLSPDEWLRDSSEMAKAKPYLEQEHEWKRRGWALKGVLLSNEEKKILAAVLGDAVLTSPWDLLEVVDHIFFPKKRILNLIVATRPRV